MKKKVRLLVVSIVLGLSLLFVSSVSGVNDEMIFEHAVAQKTLPETKSKLKIVLKKKAAKPKPKVAVKAKPKPKAKAKPKAVKKNEITFSGKTIPLVNSQGAAQHPKAIKQAIGVEMAKSMIKKRHILLGTIRVHLQECLNSKKVR